MLESEQEKEIRADIGGRTNKENSPKIWIQLSLKQAAPERTGAAQSQAPGRTIWDPLLTD